MNHNKLGQILATVLLGLEDGLAFAAQPSLLENPLALSQVISGFTSIWLTPTPAPLANAQSFRLNIPSLPTGK